jgi:hypothetical protein
MASTDQKNDKYQEALKFIAERDGNCNKSEWLNLCNKYSPEIINKVPTNFLTLSFFKQLSKKVLLTIDISQLALSDDIKKYINKVRDDELINVNIATYLERRFDLDYYINKLKEKNLKVKQEALEGLKISGANLRRLIPFIDDKLRLILWTDDELVEGSAYQLPFKLININKDNFNILASSGYVNDVEIPDNTILEFQFLDGDNFTAYGGGYNNGIIITKSINFEKHEYFDEKEYNEKLKYDTIDPHNLNNLSSIPEKYQVGVINNIFQSNSLDKYDKIELSGKIFNQFAKFHNMELVKLTNVNELHNGYQFKGGLNEDTLRFMPYGSCSAGGIYFIPKTDELLWYKYADKVMYWRRSVTVPDDARVYIECHYDNGFWSEKRLVVKFKANKIILGEREKLI